MTDPKDGGVPPGQPPDIEKLLAEPDVREAVAAAIAEAIEERRERSWWEQLKPWAAGAASALVTILAFFLPSLQDQWDRYEARRVIQRYVELGRDFVQEERYKLAEEAFAKAFELSENKRLDIEAERLEARVEQVNADPVWGKKNPEGLTESDFLYLLDFRKGRGHERQRAATLNSYGVFLAGERRWHDAEAALREAIQLDSTKAPPFVNLGNLLSDQNRTGEAEAAYRKAVLLDAQSAGAQYNLGLLLAQTGRAAEAEAALRRAVELAPDDPDALRELAAQLARNGKAAEAQEMRRRLSRLPPPRREAPAPDSSSAEGSNDGSG
jgi:tetratricopeptide (TPR) repeat protein